MTHDSNEYNDWEGQEMEEVEDKDRLHRLDARMYIQTYLVRLQNDRDPESFSSRTRELAVKLIKLAAFADSKGD